jgi:siderophore synthetase component
MKEIISSKQKAEELVHQYRMILMDEDTDCGNELLCTSIAIKNALVGVDEIWNALESARAFEEYDYWQEVKQEIKNL